MSQEALLDYLCLTCRAFPVAAAQGKVQHRAILLRQCVEFWVHLGVLRSIDKCEPRTWPEM